MSVLPLLHDPRDGSPLDEETLPQRPLPPLGQAVLDLRVERDVADEPWPATARALQEALAALDSREPYKATLEELLRQLPAERADAFTLLLKEGRGAWAPLLGSGGGRALLIGNALSGTASALVSGADVDLVQLDRSPLRAAFAAYRDADHVGPRARCIAGGDGPRLPFGDGAFDVVVIEEGLPGAGSPWAFPVAELVRVCRGELVLTVDNRFGYKRSSGRRGRFHLATPLEILRRALTPTHGERTLRGYRALVRDGFEHVRAFALYPHTRDFTHVVGLGGSGPRLTVGPRERRNVVKMAGRALGLFPFLTPSFVVIGARGERARAAVRLERTLAALSERLGEPPARIDLLVATRSNTAVVHTLPADAPRVSSFDLPARLAEGGRWTVHVPLSPRKRALIARHQGFLRRVRARFPGVPVPEPLFAGELEGLWIAAERRLTGRSAPHLTGRCRATARMLREAARHMAQLIEERTHFESWRFDELVAPRFELVAKQSGRAETARAVLRMRDELRERLVGLTLPLVLYHGDLRAKHVQVRRDGSVVGYLDWGASEEVFLPFVDLVHLVAHQRKQEEDGSPRRSWKVVQERSELREHEATALEDYQRLVGLPEAARSAIEDAYPVLVAGMAELNWDYSRPLWLHRSFGI